MKENSNNATLEDYIQYKGYRNSPNVVGLIFYGSQATGYYTDFSDYDLLIITSDGAVYEKDIEYFHSARFECQKRRYDSITDSFDSDYILISIIAHGQIIFDRNGDISILKHTASLKLKEPLKALSNSDKAAYVMSIENHMREIQKSSDGCNHLCHLTAEMIRKFYHKYKALPPIRNTKVIKVYTDEIYHEKNFFSIPLPEKEFRDLYLKVVTNNRNIKKNLQALWKYCNNHIKCNITVSSSIFSYDIEDDDEAY